jgi:2-methylaconitate cis-trans-isomerase PrpF
MFLAWNSSTLFYAGTPVSSKVCIVSQNGDEVNAVDWEFVQVVTDRLEVDESHGDCGNMLAAVGPFSLATGLASVVPEQESSSSMTRVKVHSLSTGMDYELCVPLVREAGESNYTIDTERFIRILSKNPVGSKTGCCLPTKSPSNNILGSPVSCVDVSRPMVIVQFTESMQQLTSGERPTEKMPGTDFFANPVVCEHLERIRLEAAILMGMGDVRGQVSPKMCVIAAPTVEEAVIQANYYVSPADLEVHPSIAMTAAQCLAASVFLEGTVANQLARHERICWEEKNEEVIATMSIQHPQGIASVSLHMDSIYDRSFGSKLPNFQACSYSRTTRLLASGNVYY